MLEEMKLKDVMQLVEMLKAKPDVRDEFWCVGKAYFIRTVTMHLIGNLKAINEKEMLLDNAVWVADSGRFHDALKTGKLNEVEPFVNPVIVNRASVVDATEWQHAVPTDQK